MGFAGYKPEKITDENSFDIIKDKNLVCKVNSSLIQDVEGGVSERDGQAYEPYVRLKYELEVVEGAFKGRRLWKTFNLSSQVTNKKGKAPVHNLLDIFHTAGVDDVAISSDEPGIYLAEISALNEQFVTKMVKVSAWGYTPEGRDDAMQVHKIVGEAEGTFDAVANEVPF